MAMPTPQAAAQRWANNLGASGDKIKQSVLATTTAPTALAAQAVDRQVAGVQAAAASGKTQAALNRVTLQDWQNAMINKGIPRLTSGAQQAQPKVQAFLTQFLPFLATGVQQVRAMPQGGLENGIARAVAMIRYNSGFRYQP